MQRDRLYTHGYISRTFGEDDTAQYLTRLLRVDERFLQPTSSHDWPNAFFITNPINFDAHPSIYIANRPAWLFDYELRDYGSVIPQRMWSPGTPSGVRRYNNLALNVPIFLVQNDRRTLGLRLVHAAAGDCTDLLNARAAAPVGDCHHISLRIKVSVSTGKDERRVDSEQNVSSGLATTSGPLRSGQGTKVRPATQSHLKPW